MLLFKYILTFISLFVEVVRTLQFSVLVIRRPAKLADCFKATDIEILWNTFEKEFSNPIKILQKISKLEVTIISLTLYTGEIKSTKI
jgi:hypothetical protein